MERKSRTSASRLVRIIPLVLLVAACATGAIREKILSLPQIDVIINRWFATFASDIAPAALNYANRLMQVPLGVFAQAAGTAILPTLSAYAAKQDQIGKAFPGNDPDGHRLAHEAWIKGAQARAEFWAKMRDKLAETGVVGVIGFVALAVWVAFKSEVHK